MMTNEIRKMRYMNRINLMNARTGKENGKIVKKLQRRLRNMECAESQVGDVNS
jgi:hypothetical protein